VPQLAQLEHQVTPRPITTFSQQAIVLLNELRMVALKCRVAARLDLFEACAMLSNDKTKARTAYAETLMKCLEQATGKRPLFYRPGCEDISFDEAWLTRLIVASIDDDQDSFDFLLRSRVPHWARRNFAFLIHSIAAECPSELNQKDTG